MKKAKSRVEKKCSVKGRPAVLRRRKVRLTAETPYFKGQYHKSEIVWRRRLLFKDRTRLGSIVCEMTMSSIYVGLDVRVETMEYLN